MSLRRNILMLVAPLFRGIHFSLRPLVDVTTTLSNGLLRWTGGRVFTGHLFANRDELRRLMQESARLSIAEDVLHNAFDVAAVRSPSRETPR